MKLGNIFWGLILILLGGLFYLKAVNLISDVQGWFWPLALILLGTWVLFGDALPRSAVKTDSAESFSIDLQNATRLDLAVNHGGGGMVIGGGAASGVAISGMKALGLDVKDNLAGDSLGVDISAGPNFLPFFGPESGEWRFQLTNSIPVAIKLSSGASNIELDMTDVKLTYLGVETGASSVKVKLPASAGHTLVGFNSGAASIDLIVPESVSARIRLEQGASSMNIDEKRFPRLTAMSNIYQSADFEKSANQVEIHMEGGVNSVSVR